MSGMEEVIDKLQIDIQELANTPFSVGGFSDEISLNSPVYWGELPLAGVEAFPAIEIVPILSEPAGGTTTEVWRDLTIRVTLLFDAREFYDTTETSEATATRECVRTMESIERYLEKTSKVHLDGLVRKAEVGATEYAPQLPRGTVNVSSASATVEVQIARPRSP